MSLLLKSALILTITGAVNWLIIGLFNQNFIANIFGQDSWLTKISYIIIGISSLICIAIFFLDFELDHD